MTCSFCGNEVRPDCTFSSVEHPEGQPRCICHNCVRDLYIAMIAAEMRPARAPVSNIVRSPSGGAQVIRLHPRKEQ